MHVILIPGLWLDARSWRDVASRLTEAGHRVHALTMPGVGATAADSQGIALGDWIDAVVAAIDAHDGPLALVGHSGGGNVAWGAADRRATKVSQIVFVDTLPPPPGAGISEFPIVEGVIPFPGWDFFDDEDIHDISDAVRAETVGLTASVPARIPTDPIELSDPRRYAIPVTLLMGDLDEATLRSRASSWGAFGKEFAALEAATVVRLGTAHWPQFTRPDHLAREIIRALE